MKELQLQNNYTTVEQSKRLLELGLPADSADCYHGACGGHPDYIYVRQSDFDLEDDAIFRLNTNLTPCWSVGRLMEIIDNCTICDVKDWEGIVYPSTKKAKQDLGLTYIEFLIQSIGCAMDVLDFSKLN